MSGPPTVGRANRYATLIGAVEYSNATHKIKIGSSRRQIQDRNSAPEPLEVDHSVAEEFPTEILLISVDFFTKNGLLSTEFLLPWGSGNFGEYVTAIDQRGLRPRRCLLDERFASSACTNAPAVSVLGSAFASVACYSAAIFWCPLLTMNRMTGGKIWNAGESTPPATPDVRRDFACVLWRVSAVGRRVLPQLL